MKTREHFLQIPRLKEKMLLNGSNPSVIMNRTQTQEAEDMVVIEDTEEIVGMVVKEVMEVTEVIEAIGEKEDQEVTSKQYQDNENDLVVFNKALRVFFCNQS